MNQFYVSLIFIGIILISFSLILVLLDKKKVFSFVKHFEEKKKELVEIINDAEQMIEELNKFSDYVVTQMDFKNEELSKNLKKAHDEIKELTQKAENVVRFSQEAKTVLKTEIQGDMKTDEQKLEIRQGVAVNGNSYDTTIVPAEPLFKFNSDMEIENMNFDKNMLNATSSYKMQSARTDKVIPINNKYNEVLKLYRCGMNEVDIARRLNMGKGEIHLILELNK